MTETDTQDRLISDCPDVFGRMAIYCSTLAASTLLWIAHHGIANDWLLFESARLRCLWYSEAILVPLVISFVIRGTREMYPWIAGLATAAVIAFLAAYTGGAYVADLQLHAGAIFAPYTLSLIVAFVVLMPFVQLLRDGRASFSYARLYQLCWDNTLTLLTAIVFTLTGWLILWLCGALFAVIGIDFFKELFREMIFVYPVTGLFTGFGIALGRAQIGAMRSALLVCLAITRPLLPLICGVALLFLLALAFSQLQVLWQTRHAASVALWLILSTIALVNGVFQDGSNEPPYGRFLQNFIGIALLCLPVYAGIAGYAIFLRVDQYGWSVDRLYAATITLFAGLYALGYAGSALLTLARRKAWLPQLAYINTGLALSLGIVLLSTQSALLDFRKISIADQLKRLENDQVSPALLDLKYLRFELGLPGYETLKELGSGTLADTDPDFAERVQNTLSATNRHTLADNNQLAGAFQAGKIRVWPADAILPDDFENALQGNQMDRQPHSDCSTRLSDCVLLQVELNNQAPAEWVLVDLGAPWQPAPLFVLEADIWHLKGYLQHQGSQSDRTLREALDNNDIKVQRPDFDELQIGDTHFQFHHP